VAILKLFELGANAF